MVFQGLILALLSSISFGANHASARRGLVSGNVYTGVLLTLTLGTPSFFFLALGTGELSQIATVPILALGLFVLAGVLHFAVGRTLTYASLQHTGVTQASPLLGTNSLYTVILAIAFLGEPASATVIAAVLLVVAGVVILSRLDQNHEKVPGDKVNIGVVYSIVAALIFGITPLIVRAGLLLAPIPASAAFVSYAAALLIYTLRLIVPVGMMPMNRGRLSSPLLIAALSVNFGQLFRYYALSMAPASLVSTVINAFPLFALVFAYPGRCGLEIYSRSVLLGAVLILAGVSLLYLAP